MSELTFHFLGLALQVILVLVVLFGGAKWVGQSTQLLESLSEDFKAHRAEDKEEFKETREKIEELRVAQAASAKGKA